MEGISSVVSIPGWLDPSDQTAVHVPLPRGAMRAPHLAAGPFAQALLAQNLDTLIACDMHVLPFVQALAQCAPDMKLFPMPDPALAERLHDKWAFYQALEHHQIATPKTRLVCGPADLHALTEAPYIVKPRNMGGGAGVQKVDNLDALWDLANTLPDHMVPFLVQDYIDGEDVDVSVLAQEGRVLALCAQRWLTDDMLDFSAHPTAEAIARQIISEAGYTGVVHFDMRECRRTGALQVIEANPRFWGTADVAARAGINFAALGLAACHGRPLPPADITTLRLKAERVDALGQELSARGLQVG